MSAPENPPAFPKTLDADEVEFMAAQPGMTLRDWFAGQALTGALAGTPGENWPVEQWASAAYHMADAMLAERERQS